VLLRACVSNAAIPSPQRRGNRGRVCGVAAAGLLAGFLRRNAAAPQEGAAVFPSVKGSTAPPHSILAAGLRQSHTWANSESANGFRSSTCARARPQIPHLKKRFEAGTRARARGDRGHGFLRARNVTPQRTRATPGGDTVRQTCRKLRAPLRPSADVRQRVHRTADAQSLVQPATARVAGRRA
jgi:hypothetical protein